MLELTLAAETMNAPFAHAGEFAALTTAFCWTLTSLSFTAAGKRIGSLSVNLIRLVLAFSFFVIYCWITRGMPFPLDATPKIWIWLSLSAVFGFVVGDLCLFRAFLVIGTRLAMLLSMTLWPPIAVIISIIVFGEWLSLMQWAGIALTISGVAWVVLERKSDSNGEPEKIPLSGIMLGIGGAFGQAVGYVMIRAGMQGTAFDSFAAAQIRALAGIAGFSIVFIFIGWWPKVVKACRNRKGLLYTAVGAFFGPFLGVSFSVVAQNYTKVGVAATIISITPVLVIPFAVWLQKEKVSWRAVAGAIVAVAGVAILFLLSPQKKEEPAPAGSVAIHQSEYNNPETEKTMNRAYSAEEMRELDRKAIEDYGIPGLILMENAGRGAAEVADMMLVENESEGKVVIICGTGNNGGDGYVIARHLANWEYEVETFLAGTADKVRPGDAATNFEIAGRMNIPNSEITDPAGVEKAKEAIKRAALVVDALFGTGLQREVAGLYREIIDAINDAGKPVLAVDIPSGLSSDTGKPLGEAVRASATATFGGMKAGLAQPEAKDYSGEVMLIEISIPRFLFK